MGCQVMPAGKTYSLVGFQIHFSVNYVCFAICYI